MIPQNIASGTISTDTYTFPKTRKESDAVCHIVENAFPPSPVKEIKKNLYFARHAPDPRPILSTACELLKSHISENGNFLIHEAIYSGNRALTKLSLRHGYKDYQNKDKDTPLHVAAQVRDIAVFRLLLQYQPNLLLENRSNETVSEVALRSYQFELLSLLFKRAHTLDELIPRKRQYTFLANLWETGDSEIIMLTAKSLKHKISVKFFKWDFVETSLPAIRAWITSPNLPAEVLYFTLPLKQWQLMQQQMNSVIKFTKSASKKSSQMIIVSLQACELQSG